MDFSPWTNWSSNARPWNFLKPWTVFLKLVMICRGHVYWLISHLILWLANISNVNKLESMKSTAFRTWLLAAFPMVRFLEAREMHALLEKMTCSWMYHTLWQHPPCFMCSRTRMSRVWISTLDSVFTRAYHFLSRKPCYGVK